jgi:hypothetical protein
MWRSWSRPRTSQAAPQFVLFMMPGRIIGRGFGVVNSKATPQLSTSRSVCEKSVPDVLTVEDPGVSTMSAAAQVELLVVTHRLQFESSMLDQ